MKNILLVGFGLSGVGFVNALVPNLPPTHRLVILSQSECAYYPIASLRGSVVSGWEEKVMLPIDYFFRAFPGNDRHKILRGYSAIKLESNKVTLDKDLPEEEFEGGGREIEFEYAVLATGTNYPSPCHPPSNSSSASSLQRMLTSFQESISLPSTQTILIAGGGPVGIETAGEIASLYPDKKVILVHHGEKLMETGGWKRSLGESLENQLRDLGVELRLGESVDVGERKTGMLQGDDKKFALGSGDVEADFLFLAFGATPNTRLLSSSPAPFPSLLNDSSQVTVLPTFQLSSLSHIFAIGDITSVPEAKVWVNAQNHGPVAATNIKLMIKMKSEGKWREGEDMGLKKYSPGSKIIVISCGPNGGAGQIYLGYVMGPWMASKAKSQSLFYDKFKNAYHG